MPKVLRAASSTVTGITQQLDATGQITSYVVNHGVRYIDDDGADITTVNEALDVWPLLTAQQQQRLQNIQDTIMTRITNKYFA